MLIPGVVLRDLYGDMHSTQIQGRRCNFVIRACKTLLRCPLSLSAWPHQFRMAPQLMLGARECFGKVMSSLTLLDVSPAPSLLGSSSVVFCYHFGTLLAYTSLSSQSLCTLYPLFLLPLNHPTLLCNRGTILLYISSRHLVYGF